MNIPGARFLLAEYSPDRKRGFMGSWLDFGSLPSLCWVRRGGVYFDHCRGANFLDWGWRIPSLLLCRTGIIGLYLRHALEEAPAFQQHVDKLEQGDWEGLQDGPKVPSKRLSLNAGAAC
ncbi:MFS transporter [Shigella flexneri]